MRGAPRRRPFRPWLSLSGGIAFVLAVGTVPAQPDGVLHLSFGPRDAASQTIICPGGVDRPPEARSGNG
ncbi:hypothetical protein [Nonomuraea lactucae]|uniref:hypothetical protein n=1 Tax=Nonomuraea lactucae TaxID=2249762 RepID=UPI000DE44EEC|nr:hypothetical protein [Nonomuraea lactucae]